MDITYSKEQQKVIDTRACNILVSAAAGSGKTAVLVERIVQLITNKEKLISIHQLLVVTFTHMAAYEMRERIGGGIEKAIEKETDAQIIRHLLRQLTLLPTANIMTLHSFCMTILKSNYHLLGLDPKFRIGNETELVLMREEVIDEILEVEYKEGTPSFLNVIESFSPGKNDEPIKELIFQIYRFAMSHPWPLIWMDESLEAMHVTTIEALCTSPYYQLLIEVVQGKIGLIEENFKKIDELMNLEMGPKKYLDTVNGYKDFVKTFKEGLETKQYAGLAKLYYSKDIAPLGRGTKGYDKDLAAEAKNYIDEIRTMIDGFTLVVFNENEIMADIKVIQGVVLELVRLTKQFHTGYARAKESKALIDFNDIEHFALDILYESGVYSKVAKLYKGQFVEVLVDEYQDTNEVQEAILLSVSNNEGISDNNLFMVGDLKQSIYKFRLAKPEIFSSKYDAYTYDASDCIKIDLSQNYRSRREVIDFSNHIFERIMSKRVGDVVYDDHTKLYYSAFGFEDVASHKPELIFVEENDADQTKTSLQAMAVAGLIQALMEDDSFTITEKGIQRRPKYSDICILMRSPQKSVEELKDVFDLEGIPYQLGISSGYFDAIEVQIVLNFLRILDNPYQDIPLVSVLRSPLVNMAERDLLTIREFKTEGTYYEALLAFSQSDMENTELTTLIQKFLSMYEQFKEESRRLPLSQVIRSIYTKTGYPYVVNFMENGNQRFTNLKFLEVHAKKFEQSSYKGLFNFIRYVEHIKKYEIAMPEPIANHMSDEGVKMISIHKSKGLEFPIVFLIETQKQFNRTDIRKNFILHQDLGFGCDYIDPLLRVKKESVFAKAIKEAAKKELISEELRLLYVALTRAKEKLYVVASVKKYEEKSRVVQEQFAGYIKEVPSILVEKANSLLDFILMSCPPESPLYSIKYLTLEEIQLKGAFNQLGQMESKKQLRDLLTYKKPLNDDVNYERVFESYPYEAATKMYTTLSVSEIKDQQKKMLSDTLQIDEVAQDEKLIKEAFPDESCFETATQDEDVFKRGAKYGTLMHKVLLHLPLQKAYTKIRIIDFLQNLTDENIISNSDKNTVSIDRILAFTKTDLYNRMVNAEENKQLYKEQPFVLGIRENGDLRMVQGVIDVFFMEDNELVLLDYKTDYIKAGEEKKLLERYKVQLEYYRKALEDILFTKVGEAYIYSLSLGKAIVVEKEELK